MGRSLILAALILISSGLAAQGLEPQDLIIDDIQCAGNALTDCEIIKREIYASPGEKINEEEIANSKIRLQLLALFKTVSLRLEKGAQRGHVILVAEVEEASPLFNETYVHLPSGDLRADFSLKVGHRNLFGKGKVLQALVEPANLFRTNYGPTRFGLEYIDPHLFGEKKYFLGNRTTFDKDFVHSYGEYWSNNFTIGRRFFDFSYITLGYGTNWSTSRDHSYFSQGYTASYGWNSEDDPYFVSEGSKLEITHYFYERSNFGPTLLTLEKAFPLSRGQVFTLHSFDQYIPAFPQYGSDSRVELGLQYALQLSRQAEGRTITDSRIYIEPQVQHEKFGNGTRSTYCRLEGGLLLMSTQLGFIKLSTSFGYYL
ncbi:MAG: hypothetical protein ACXWQE_04230 [Bdellovibrionales bacterium]